MPNEPTPQWATDAAVAIRKSVWLADVASHTDGVAAIIAKHAPKPEPGQGAKAATCIIWDSMRDDASPGEIMDVISSHTIEPATHEKVVTESERLAARDGNATISLSYPAEGRPFNFDECTVVDFGVADNCYVVESPYLAKVVEQRDGLLEAIRVALCDEGWDDPSRDGMDYLGPVPVWAQRIRAALAACEKVKP